MEGNFRLIINIEGHNANLHCLFWYFKNIWPFLLILISLNKDIFSFLLSDEKNLALSEKRHFFHWWHSPSCFVKFLYHYELYFPAIAMWYSSSTITTMKASVPWEYKVSVRQLLKFTFIYKKNIFEKYYQKPLPTYFNSKT